MTDLKLANLTKKHLKEIADLEDELGINLVAYVKEDNSYANIDAKSINKIKELEKKLGIIILAYPIKKSA